MFGWVEAAAAVIIFFMGLIIRAQDRRLTNLETFEKETYEKREEDARLYLTKEEGGFKEALKRIEDGVQDIKDSA